MSRTTRVEALRLAGWALVGAMLAAGLAAAFTPVVLLALPALGLAALLVATGGIDRRTCAALAGAAWLPLWLAWSNREGPGEVCALVGTGSTCTTTDPPWPFLVVGVLMLAVGLGLALGKRRRTPTPRSDAPVTGPARLR